MKNSLIAAAVLAATSNSNSVIAYSDWSSNGNYPVSEGGGGYNRGQRHTTKAGNVPKSVARAKKKLAAKSKKRNRGK